MAVCDQCDGWLTLQGLKMSAAAELNFRPFAVRNVLLVGGDPEVNALLREILQMGEWAISHDPNNAAVLAMLRRKSFDLVLTSEKTSGSEDVELLRKIKSLRPHTRLIILTDESTPADVIAAMCESAFSYFSKPFSKDALVAMIRNAMEQPCWNDGIDVISATPEWMRVVARCDLQTAERVLQFFDEIAELENPEKTAVGMAFREMLLNAIEHGGILIRTIRSRSPTFAPATW
jgi:CheY-like chemotaxis protein